MTLTVGDAFGNTTTRAATTSVAAPTPAITTFELTKTKILALARVIAKKAELVVVKP